MKGVRKNDSGCDIMFARMVHKTSNGTWRTQLVLCGHRNVMPWQILRILFVSTYTHANMHICSPETFNFSVRGPRERQVCAPHQGDVYVNTTGLPHVKCLSLGDCCCCCFVVAWLRHPNYDNFVCFETFPGSKQCQTKWTTITQKQQTQHIIG